MYMCDTCVHKEVCKHYPDTSIDEPFRSEIVRTVSSQCNHYMIEPDTTFTAVEEECFHLVNNN